MDDGKSKVMSSVDMLIDYKRGLLTKEQAIQRFSYITGLTPDIANEFIRGMKKENIVSFPGKKRKVSKKHSENS